MFPFSIAFFSFFLFDFSFFSHFFEFLISDFAVNYGANGGNSAVALFVSVSFARQRRCDAEKSSGTANARINMVASEQIG